MMYDKIIICDNPDAEKDNKRALAEITKANGKIKIVKFGLYKSGGTFFDGVSEDKKKNYITRHSKKEKWGPEGICTAGFYSRWVLWESRNKTDIINAIKSHTGINKVVIKKLKKIKVTNML